MDQLVRTCTLGGISMARKSTRQALVLLCLIAMLAVGTVGVGTAAAATNGTIKNEGPCDKKLSEVKVGSIIPGSNPTLDLQDQADALITSAKVFNKKYKGIGGHCIAVDWCDPKVDPNAAADCARKIANSDAVATLNDTTPNGGDSVVEILKNAVVPRVDVSPGTPEPKDPNSYAIGAGGAGTTFMMVPPLTRAGVKKIWMIAVDNPQIAALAAIMGTMAKAYGAEIIGVSKVPAGTTDFQQFVLAAPLGNN